MFGITNPLAAASKGEDSLKEVDLVVYNMSKLTIIKGEMKEFSEAVYKKEDYFMLPLAETLHELGFEVGQIENGIATTASEFSVYNDIVKINEKEFKIETKNDTAYISNQFLVELGYRMFEEKEMLMIYKTDILSKLNVDVIYKMQGIYVSTDSRSGATGTASDPVASLEAAKNIAEKYISVYGDSYPVNIYVHGGSYFFEETVNFKKSYFGRADIKGIAIKAFGDGEPIFTGARKLNPSNFVPVTDAIMLSRLPKDARGRVAVMDLNSENITGLSTSQATFPFIYINDQEMPISQWPNSGFTTTKSTPENGVFGYDGTNPSRWTMANDARIWAYFVGDYFYGTAEIDKVNAQAGLITYSNGPKFPLGSSGRRWKAVNLLEEIDIPGEWYVDRESNKLYLYPPYTLNNAKVEITTLHDKPFIQADEINGLEISGITFEKGGSRAVYCAVPGNNITIKKCRFLYIQGDYAIHIKNYQTTYNLDISENEFYGCAGGAVLAKPGDTITLTPSNSKITNNRVTSCGYYPAYINAVFMGSENSRANHNAVETVIENNLIQDCTTVYAMSLTGFENKFRYNEIVNQSKYVDDGGAIYFGMSYHKYGNEIAYNYLHDFNMEHFLCGLYNDDAYSGAYWHNNICYNIPRVSINGTGRIKKLFLI